MIRRLRRHNKGFTLAELLVAIVILGILSMCIYLITQAAGYTFSRGEEIIASDDVKDLVLEYIKQELRNSSQMWLVSNIEAYGAENIMRGRLLFVSDRDGYLYTLPADVDGEMNFDYSDGYRAMPHYSVGFFSRPNDIYGNYFVSVVFDAIVGETGKMQALKVTVYVYEKSSPDEIACQGAEVISLINMKQQNNAIILVDSPQDSGVYDAYYYCFYA